MLTSIDEVWARMKETARDYAAKNVPVGDAQALDAVSDLMRRARVRPWPDEDTLSYFAGEFRAMVAAAKND